MAKRTIIWTETAAKQRRLILEFWVKNNGSTTYSEKLIRQIARQTRYILKNPTSFKMSEYPDTRESAMNHFSIYYKITNQNIIITAFWDNRQNPKKLLALLK
jgi:plasmid stabilization system protein ParE